MDFQPKTIKPSRVWVGLFYPEDGSIQNVIYKLENSIHCNAWISPLHAPEVTEDGMERKPHYHLELIFEGKQSFERIQEIFDFCGIKYPRVCTSKRGYARYLCHLDNPEKEQFDTNEVYQVGDDNYFECISSSSNDLLVMSEICEWCYQNEIFEYWYLYLHAFNQNWLEWCRIIKNQAQFFKSFLSSMAYSYRKHGSLKDFKFDILEDNNRIKQIRKKEIEVERLKLVRLGVPEDVAIAMCNDDILY